MSKTACAGDKESKKLLQADRDDEPYAAMGRWKGGEENVYLLGIKAAAALCGHTCIRFGEDTVRKLSPRAEAVWHLSGADRAAQRQQTDV